MIATAHGRVNLIGEHTDYNHGFVLPTLIPQQTTVSAELRTDSSIHVNSTSLGEIHCELGQERRTSHWSDYVFGVTHILAKAGFGLKGVNLKITSDVPIGSGLSSSAALILATIRALRSLFSLDLTDLQTVTFCQRIENEFVGARVGIMDPMACALARLDHALFVDTRSLATQQIPLPTEATLLVIHSGVSHRNVGGGYNERRSQCEDAAARLKVQSLRDVDMAQLRQGESLLTELLFHRAHHVISENDRVLQCVEALTRNDLERVGQLFDASHSSMRDDYQVSTPEVDQLVECVRRQPGVFGARLTGGGFGGSIIALVARDKVQVAASKATTEYAQVSGQKPLVLVPSMSLEKQWH